MPKAAAQRFNAEADRYSICLTDRRSNLVPSERFRTCAELSLISNHLKNPSTLLCSLIWYGCLCVLLYNVAESCGSPQPPKGRNSNPSGLGRAIINKKAKDARIAHETGIVSSTPLILT